MDDVNLELQAFLDKQIARKNTHSILLGVKSANGNIRFQGAAGAAKAEQPFFMASITKMFTATVLMQLADEGKLQLDDKVISYFSPLEIEGLHRIQRQDYTKNLTLRHLVHQTSGLADYYEGSFAKGFLKGHDRAYDLTDVIEAVRGMAAQAIPDSGRSYYSDTNYQLLGAIIEKVTGCSLGLVFSERIFEPLGMNGTFIFDCTRSYANPRPVSLYYKSIRLELPLALSSMAPDGGGVWTLEDGLRFLSGYFGGELFDSANLSTMQKWNKLFFPIEYGYGVMRFALPRSLNLFRYTAEFIGHSGSSGSWAFYAPKEEIFLVGSVSQLDARRRPFQLLPQIVQLLK